MKCSMPRATRSPRPSSAKRSRCGCACAAWSVRSSTTWRWSTCCPAGWSRCCRPWATTTTANADAPIWKKRLGGGGSWKVQYADIREDRVVFYGAVDKDLLEVTYKARATNVGDFVVPAAYGEAMYDRRVYSRSAGARFQVVAN
jgi:hypothetical protein